jgi:isoquinoline 1-oxidoreductase beta subunit
MQGCWHLLAHLQDAHHVRGAGQHCGARGDDDRVPAPDQARAQVEGGVIQGLSTTLLEAVTIANGAAVERNFDRYRLLTIADAPPVIDVRFDERGEPLGGVGEPPVPPVIPAVANAISRLTGRRVRTLPILPPATA